MAKREWLGKTETIRKKPNMRVVLSKLRGVWPVTGRDEKHCGTDECVKVTARNLTTSDHIVLAALITCLLVLSHAVPIVYDNQKEKGD